MKFSKYAVLAAMALLVVSCCPCRKAGSEPTPLAKNKVWTLVSINGARQPAGENFNITFGDDDRITGIGDCNRLTGSYKIVAGGGLTISGVAATRMFCPNQQMEDEFVKTLQGVDGYSMDSKKNILMLLQDSQAVLIFEPKK